jgi:hypothetical protein
MIELKPLTLEEFLELIYMSSDVLHDALVAWVKNEDTYNFIASLLAHLPKEDALKLIPMFLHVDEDWLNENASADEAYEALKQSVRLNDWSDMIQAMIVLDTVKFEEVVELWQMVKTSGKKL